MFKQMPTKPLDIDKACELLGTTCEKTVKRHYKLIGDYIKSVTALMSFWISSHPEISKLPVFHPDYSLIRMYLTMQKEIVFASQILFGNFLTKPHELWLLAPCVFVHKSRFLPQKPLNLSFLLRFYFDTS
jgi:hypothetical protein